jgi:hypothetical protein
MHSSTLSQYTRPTGSRIVPRLRTATWTMGAALSLGGCPDRSVDLERCGNRTVVEFVGVGDSSLDGLRMEVSGDKAKSICHFPADNGPNASELCEPEGVGRFAGRSVIFSGEGAQTVHVRIVRETIVPEETLLDETKTTDREPYDCLGTIYHESNVEFDLSDLELDNGLGGGGGEAPL